MLTLGIEYLTGYAVATDAANRDRPEWPPHPARVFMAMAAAFFETGEDPAEKAALVWLEKLERHPAIRASDCDERSLVTHFVPVNDELNASGAALPILRRRQARGFPRVRPHDPRVFLSWKDADVDPNLLESLRSLCEKVTRIGHSSSLVRMWVEAAEPQSSSSLTHWIADDDLGDQQLRVVGGGAMDELVAIARVADLAEFDRLTEQSRTAKGAAKADAKRQLSERFSDLRPQPLRPAFRITAGYRCEQSAIAPALRSVWDRRLLVFGLERIESSYSRLDVRATLAVTRAFRDAAMSVAGQRGEVIDESLSGHRPDGSPSQSPHCAFFTLPFVGDRHADGHLVGVAVACARDIAETQRRRIAAILGAIPELVLGALGRWKLIPSSDAGNLTNLRPRTWCADPDGATKWATVTPIVFDDHPKAKDKVEYLDEVSAMIRRSCQRVIDKNINIVDVVPSHVSRCEGTPPSRQFPRLTRKDHSERRHLHATLVFDRPVVGPILLGAGRYRGYGLLRPITGERR